MQGQLLELDNVRRTYKVQRHRSGPISRSEVRAVDGITFAVKPHETVGLVGESGCGKSTLARIMVGLERPVSGAVSWQGRNVADMSKTERRDFHRQVQLVFQDPHAALDPRRTAFDSVSEGLEAHKLVPVNRMRERVGELLEQVGLPPAYMNRYPHEFSGGQLQRVGIARALAVEPRVLVCDEPVSALDISVRAQVLNLLNRLKDELDLAIVFIAHDLDIVQHMSDRIVTMYLGRIVEQGETDALYDAPAHPYTEALLSAIPGRRARTGGQRIVLEGDPPSPIDIPDGCPFHVRCYVARPECSTRVPVLKSLSGQVSREAACHFAEEVVASSQSAASVSWRSVPTPGSTGADTASSGEGGHESAPRTRGESR